MIGQWGFVALAYGIVWTAIVVYVFFLKRRYKRAQTDLSTLASTQTIKDHDQA